MQIVVIKKLVTPTMIGTEKKRFLLKHKLKKETRVYSLVLLSLDRLKINFWKWFLKMIQKIIDLCEKSW